MSRLIDSYDGAANALRKARAINDVIYRATEEESQLRSFHDSAETIEDYLGELREHLKALYEAARERVADDA